MKVFKFGGASVGNYEAVRNVANILRSFADQKILVVISAMGKTTNALEKVAEAFYAGNREEALSLFSTIRQHHLSIAKYLLVKNFNRTFEELLNFFTEVEWLLHDNPVRPFDYYYDQIVCIGELLSSCIVSAYLEEMGQPNQWLDVRDVLRTDDNFREANIEWAFTAAGVKQTVAPFFKNLDVVVTQGSIGATSQNESTSLGREGSDYTAAVLASMLDAESLTIWKDVDGLMSADPRRFPAAVLIPEINYREVLEMAYYGAQVIHPKTIKPLQNKGLTLYVRSFVNSNLAGTTIHSRNIKDLPPLVMFKENQVLLQLAANDYSFAGDYAARFYQLFETCKLKPNLSQNSAISFLCCLDDHAERIAELAMAAAEFFDVQLQRGLTLITIRHYTEELLETLTAGQHVVLKQQSGETVQVLVSDAKR